MSGWIGALTGGVLIGLSATLLLWLNGRIAGISGIVNGLTSAPVTDRGWRLAFLAGLLLAGGLVLHVVAAAPPREHFPRMTLVVAGLLVGIGTGIGNGCTSGHGVCGLGRLSLRSLIAVLVFMATAMLTVFVVRHVLGASQ